MKQPAMVDQVDRIIRNTLLLRREICLPEVGSLYIALQGAARHKHRLTPSCQRVCFTSRERGESLIAILAREIDGDTTQATDIYHRWLSHARHDNRLTVSCCGVLHHKHFSMNGDFDTLLNPFGRGSLALIPRRRPALWLAAAASVLLLAGAGYVGYTHFAKKTATTHTTAADATATNSTAKDATVTDARPNLGPEHTSATEAAAETTATAATATAMEAQPSQQPAKGQATDEEQMTGKERAATDAAAANTRASASAAKSATGQVRDAAPERLVSGRSYVVLGVFSTEANARRAAGNLTADAEIEARIHPYGPKWMVSIYESDNRNACLEFIRSKSADHPDLWPYTAK